jgi:para-nitrobenzyl esterase
MSTGSASWPLYDFANLSRHQRVVVVGINHRLGVLGFLDLSQIDHDFGESGNVGMMDVVADIPLVSGCTTDEMMAFLMANPGLWALDLTGLRHRLVPLLRNDADEVLARYQAALPDDSTTSLLIAIHTDFAMWIPHVRLTEAKLQGGGTPAWMYQFAWGHPDPEGRVRAGHGSDMPYFFDNIDKAPMASGPHAAPLVAAMSGALAAFAHTGDPNHHDLSRWPSYTLEDRPTMQFDVSPKIACDPFESRRRCWDGIAVGSDRLQ